ncbi:MAG: addiction module protein [Verrucomicrobiota bacterium]
MPVIELENLPTSEKFLLLEAIWDDFRETYEKSGIPEEHKKELDSRLNRFEKGESKVLDWDSVKDSIGKR